MATTLSYDMDAVKSTQINLDRLSRALRSVASRRRNEFYLISKATHTMQKDTVSEWEQHTQDIHQDIVLESQLAHRKGQMQGMAHSIEVMDDSVRFHRKRGEVILDGLSKRIKSIDKTIETRLMSIGDFNTFSTAQKSVQRNIHRLEHRLDKARVKLNNSAYVLKDLKTVLDNLNRAHRMMVADYDSLRENLSDTTRMITEKVEFSNQNMDDRHEAEETLARLEMAQIRLEELFRVEWQKVYQVFMKKQALHDRLRGQRQGLVPIGTGEEADFEDGDNGMRNHASSPTEGKIGLLGVDLDSILSSKPKTVDGEDADGVDEITKIWATAVWSNALDMVKLELFSSRLDQLEQGWERLSEELDVDDADELVEQFKDIEADNAHSFAEIHELKRQTILEEKQIEEAESEIQRLDTMTLKPGLAGSMPKRQYEAASLWRRIQSGSRAIASLEKQKVRAYREWRNLKHSIRPLLDEFRQFGHVPVEELGKAYDTDEGEEVSDAWTMDHLSLIDSATRVMLKQV